MTTLKNAANWLAGRWKARPIPWMILGIALVAFLAYANSLGNYFLIDDFWHFDKAAKTSWGDVLKPWTYSGEDFKAYWFNEQRLQGAVGHGYFRPIVTGFYKVSLKIFGLNAWCYHLVSILFHVATSAAVFAIARLFFKPPWIAAVAALLFAVHPSHAECVQWVAANGNGFEGFFTLTGFAAFGWYLRQGRRWQYGLSLTAFFFGLCTKESAIVLPVVLLIYDVYRRHMDGEKLEVNRALVLRHLPFWILSAGYLAIQCQVVSGVLAVNQGGIYIHKIFTLSFLPFVLFNLTYGMLHLTMLVPLFPLNPDELTQKFGGWQVSLVCLAILIAMVWILKRLIGTKRGWSFFPLFTVLTLAPTFPVLVGQRFLYVPSLGWCLALGALLERITRSDWYLQKRCGLAPLPARQGLGLAVILVILFHFSATLFLNFMWSFPSNLVRRQVEAIHREAPVLARGSSLYLLDLWPPAFGVELILPLVYNDPTLDVQVLTIHPKILPLEDTSSDNLLMRCFARFLPDQVGKTVVEKHWETTNRLRVQIEGGGYMRSLIEEIYPASPSLQKSGAQVDLPRFSAEVVRADEAGVKELVFRFQPGAVVPRTVLDVTHGHAHRLEP